MNLHRSKPFNFVIAYISRKKRNYSDIGQIKTPSSGNEGERRDGIMANPHPQETIKYKLHIPKSQELFLEFAHSFFIVYSSLSIYLMLPNIDVRAKSNDSVQSRLPSGRSVIEKVAARKFILADSPGDGRGGDS